MQVLTLELHAWACESQSKQAGDHQELGSGVRGKGCTNLSGNVVLSQTTLVPAAPTAVSQGNALRAPGDHAQSLGIWQFKIQLGGRSVEPGLLESMRETASRLGSRLASHHRMTIIAA